ncbi:MULTISPECIES: P22 phage major capsid protein family protein [unclassified Microbacterium]|uniref:P22 phage major capsid protein family protein n=1 Tax=unclassified Microbacterium TaxID=2609290 RepID=UPI0004002807|nr:P22 phage major capsid protein family protein [Microbacterium sp. B24]
MPHVYDYDAAQAAVVSAKFVEQDGFLSALVGHDYQDEFLAPGTANRPIKVKFPTTLFARERDIDDVTSNIELDYIAESGTTINLDKKMVYSAVPLSEGDLNLKLTDFSRQVLRPQAAAIADDIENRVATKLLAVPRPSAAQFSATYDPTNPVKYFTALRAFLRKQGVPQAGIQVAVGVGIYSDLINAKAIQDASQSGSTAALREGQVGKVLGFTLIESTRLADNEVLMFHKDAVTLVTRAPAVPAGASFGASVAEGGYNLRYLRDYDAMKTVDRSILATFVGVGILPTFKIVRNRTTRVATYEPIPNGGIAHIPDVTVAAS